MKPAAGHRQEPVMTAQQVLLAPLDAIVRTGFLDLVAGLAEGQAGEVAVGALGGSAGTGNGKGQQQFFQRSHRKLTLRHRRLGKAQE